MKTELNRFARGQRDAWDITSLFSRSPPEPSTTSMPYLSVIRTQYSVGGMASVVRQTFMR